MAREQVQEILIALILMLVKHNNNRAYSLQLKITNHEVPPCAATMDRWPRARKRYYICSCQLVLEFSNETSAVLPETLPYHFNIIDNHVDLL
jgi:hypothetical protein